jgi:hypothetical protein
MYDQAGNIVDRRELLKIKIKSLAEEARIIRKEEKKVGTLRYVFVPPQPLSKENMKRWTRSQRERMLHGYWRRVRMSVNPLSDEMYHHRLKLGHETRLTQVAYALVRGKSYEQVEHGCRKEKQLKEADWERIYAMCRKYGDPAQFLLVKDGGQKAA